MRKQDFQRIMAITFILGFELLVAFAVTAVAACGILPLTYAERGYWAVGGEWLVLMFIAMAAYNAIHGYLFKDTKNTKRRRTR